jgi:2-amino-4-hydroxy-6-hydroxymethyldihydropteridine diphosphokinase
MIEIHLAYLNLGSNIQPQTNLPTAVNLLSQYGEILKCSNAWESKSVGAIGPNFLNACVLFKCTFDPMTLKDEVIHPIEAQLGRRRNQDKNAPRTIDIDIIVFDDKPLRDNIWETAFVIVPLADIYPEYQHPTTGEAVREIAKRLRQRVWLEPRRGVFDTLN